MPYFYPGSPMEITSYQEDGPQYGVDITHCAQMRFRMKTCSLVNIWLGDGTATGSYEIFMGGREYNMTGLSNCTGGPSSCPLIVVQYTHGLLKCDEYRNFWVSWGNNGVAFGTGSIPHSGVIVSAPAPLVHDIAVLGHFVNSGNVSATIKLGDDNRSLYELTDRDRKYTSTSLVDADGKDQFDCGLLCHAHPQCGRFSYNKLGKKCQLFDRDLSNVAYATSGWDSWKMIYCN